MAHKYTTVRLLSETAAVLRIEAAIRGISMAELLDIAVRRESKDGAKALTASAGRPAAEKRHNGSSRRGRGRP
jgi:hypothetical protein